MILKLEVKKRSKNKKENSEKSNPYIFTSLDIGMYDGTHTGL
ncbi:hypothetical protein [Staphylococcus epidermidis]|nr:hypothetical protein [Staphylococcus epidermidis]